MSVARPRMDWIGSPNYRAQQGVQKLFWVDHWMVGNLAGTDRLFQSESNGVATQLGIEEGVIHQYVNFGDYAYGSGDSYANKYGISAEHAGGWLMPDGSRYTPNAATMESSAQALAYVADLYGWGRIQYGVNQFIHANFVATACPGSTPFNARNERAQQIRDGLTKKRKRQSMYIVHQTNAAQTVNERFLLATDFGFFEITRAQEALWNRLLFPGTSLDVESQFTRLTAAEVKYLDDALRANAPKGGGAPDPAKWGKDAAAALTVALPSFTATGSFK